MREINYATETKRLQEIGAICAREQVQIAVPDAKDIMMRGLRYYIGEQAQWLPEYDQVADWLSDNQGKGLLCYGNCGRGKTELASRVIPAIIHYWDNRVVKCYTAEEIGMKLDDAKLAKLSSIDDIGTEGVTNIYGNRMFALPTIVDEAERRGNLIILSSNLTLSEIKKKYGARTMDRLRQICVPVLFAGDSLRGK